MTQVISMLSSRNTYAAVLLAGAVASGRIRELFDAARPQHVWYQRGRERLEGKPYVGGEYQSTTFPALGSTSDRSGLARWPPGPRGASSLHPAEALNSPLS